MKKRKTLENGHKHDEEYIKEYTRMLKEYAGMAAERPDLIDSMREMLKMSAGMMVSNRPEAVKNFRRAAEDLDAFLAACQSGEIDPKKFIEEN